MRAMEERYKRYMDKACTVSEALLFCASQCARMYVSTGEVWQRIVAYMHGTVIMVTPLEPLFFILVWD